MKTKYNENNCGCPRQQSAGDHQASENISDEEIVSLNLPTAVPYVFEFDDEMNLQKDYFLGDPEEIRKLMEAVANQGKSKVISYLKNYIYHHGKMIRRKMAILDIIQHPIFLHHNIFRSPDIIDSAGHFRLYIKGVKGAGCSIRRQKGNPV